ncbi:MAG: hypothetical protein AVDCRST_MAG01-01-5097 [uncultured Rubrobacteraceae bacterium]|uniref:Uncharacterized protein n=1 Tax=uncultured Rubrobacteraceae bacterium TaxID=349277 RepID=A0A6J4QXH0_9ACTN|nr:MAG: hypothetical protein AVDCRST_MAG01-01-5097 [uncultured Rubrobacteraceae bacterium]
MSEAGIFSLTLGQSLPPPRLRLVGRLLERAVEDQCFEVVWPLPTRHGES